MDRVTFYPLIIYVSLSKDIHLCNYSDYHTNNSLILCILDTSFLPTSKILELLKFDPGSSEGSCIIFDYFSEVLFYNRSLHFFHDIHIEEVFWTSCIHVPQLFPRDSIPEEWISNIFDKSPTKMVCTYCMTSRGPVSGWPAVDCELDHSVKVVIAGSLQWYTCTCVPL